MYIKYDSREQSIYTEKGVENKTGAPLVLRFIYPFPRVRLVEVSVLQRVRFILNVVIIIFQYRCATLFPPDTYLSSS